MEMIPGSSMVEHSAVNRRVASSNLARGAKFSFSFNHLQTATFSSFFTSGKVVNPLVRQIAVDQQAMVAVPGRLPPNGSRTIQVL
jgi:hypothetical protein